MNLEAINNIINSEKITIIDFYAAWCQPCKAITKQLVALDTQKYNIIKVDIDKYPEIAEHYNVSAIPHILYFKSSNLIKSTVGVVDLSKILESI